jgi:hypothetical protein
VFYTNSRYAKVCLIQQSHQTWTLNHSDSRWGVFRRPN